MAPRASNTRDQIMDRARDLLQSQGIEGFSYRDISTHLGIRNAAVHYHFPSKDDLGLALVQQFAAEIRGDIACAREQDIPPRQQLEVFFQRANAEVEQGCCICAFGALSAAYDRLPHNVQAALADLRELIQTWLTDTLDAGRQSGAVHFAGEPADKALQVLTAVQGARQLSKMAGKNLVKTIIAQFRTELYPARDAAGSTA